MIRPFHIENRTLKIISTIVFRIIQVLVLGQR